MECFENTLQIQNFIIELWKKGYPYSDIVLRIDEAEIGKISKRTVWYDMER